MATEFHQTYFCNGVQQQQQQQQQQPAVATQEHNPFLPDYAKAWSILENPKKVENAAKLSELIEFLGITEASDLKFLTTDKIKELAACLKPVGHDTFLIATIGCAK